MRIKTTYPGGKNGSGVYQKIISMMPKHKVYIEAFLGSGAILRNKKPALYNIGIDLDSSVFSNYDKADIDRDMIDLCHFNGNSNLQLFTADSITLLKDIKLLTAFCANISNPKDTLIYADPPYLKSVRSSQRAIYKHELLEETEHCKLLEVLKSLSCNVMISHYKCDFYDHHLKDWRTESFQTTNRAGNKVIETVYMNFAEPMELHDYSFLGSNFRERERIKRKCERWKNRLLNMDAHEKFALMATIEELKNPVLSSNMTLLDQLQK